MESRSTENIDSIARDLATMTAQLELLARKLDIFKKVSVNKREMYESTVEVPDAEPSIPERNSNFHPEAGP